MSEQMSIAVLGARQMARSRCVKLCLHAVVILAIPILLLLRSAFFPASGLPGLIVVLATAGAALSFMKFLDKKATHTIKRAKDAERGAAADLARERVIEMPAA